MQAVHRYASEPHARCGARVTHNLEAMVRKRHEGPAWIVFEQLANATGASCSRHVDMAALSMWTSHGAFAFHVYELKRSRGDLQKELKDPRKADAIGQYADYFWLVVDDVKIIDGIVLPENFGVLAPKNQVLRVVTKAPKLTPKPMTRGFVAAMIRNVTTQYVPRAQHQELRDGLDAKVREGVERAKLYNREDAGSFELDALKKAVALFEEKSGVQINRYNAANIGDAVRIVLEARNTFGQEALKRNIGQLERTAHQLEWIAKQSREAVKSLSTLVVDEKQAELPFHDYTTGKMPAPPARDDLQTVAPGAVLGPSS